MKQWKNDVAVLLIFFTRDNVFAKTFAAVKEARPRYLLLWQDGPRENHPNDINGIERCRQIAENIDWECEVYKNYQDKNWGCDPSTFYAHKWAFSIVDKCIILEDDCVPSQSFFPFCKELLDKYEKDTRINKICGVCNFADFKSPYSYIFSTIASGPGFATWKRVADTWDEKYSFMNDNETMNSYFKLHRTYNDKKYYKTCLLHVKDGYPHWETIQTYSRHLNSQFVIIPTVNQIHNIGVGEDSTHSNIDISNLSNAQKTITYQDAKEIQFPLIHPKYVFEDITYKNRLFTITGKNNRIAAYSHRAIRLARMILKGNILKRRK